MPNIPGTTNKLPLPDIQEAQNENSESGSVASIAGVNNPSAGRSPIDRSLRQPQGQLSNGGQATPKRDTTPALPQRRPSNEGQATPNRDKTPTLPQRQPSI